MSPSLAKEYLKCPRSFLFSNQINLSFFPPNQLNQFIYAQERIDQITYEFFSVLKSHWKENSELKSRIDVKFLLETISNSLLNLGYESDNKELDEKVLLLLRWLILYLWEIANDRKISFYMPKMINQYIKAPELGLHGRPSAIFAHNDKNVLILIQTYQFMNVQLQNLPYIQVAIYSRILESMGLKVIDFLYVNYYNMIIIKKTFTDKFYEKLDKFLEFFRSNIVEYNYEPPKNPPCTLCEFKMICEALG